MRVGLPAVEFTSLCDFLESGDTLCAAGINTDNVDRARRQYALELIQRPLALAISDASRGLGAQVCVALGIPGAKRLLDPREIVFLHGLGAPDGVGDVPLDRD